MAGIPRFPVVGGSGLMETWITPALLIALAALMVGMLRSLRNDMDKRIDGVRDELGNRIDGVRDELGNRIESVRGDLGGRIDRVEQRMDRLESGLVEVKEGLAEVRGELRFVRDYILHRNLPSQAPPAAPAE